MKRYLIFTSFILCCLAIVSFLPLKNDGTLQKIIDRLTLFQQHHAQEKLYLHFDKPIYDAGEDMWFKAYLVNAVNHKPDSASRVIHVELIDSERNILTRILLYSNDGFSHGDFHLGDTLPQGKYFIRAYTNHMKNAGEEFFFIKEFSLFSSNTRQTHTEEQQKNDSIDLQFFPEGGDLIANGISSVIGFKALAPDGRSIEIEGEIRDETDALITTFKSKHKGMGSFRLTAKEGKSYTAIITAPYPIERAYQLPPVVLKGYSIQVTDLGNSFKVIVVCNNSLTSKSAINLLAQSRGSVHYAATSPLTKNYVATSIAKSKLPDGITQLTVFDETGTPQCERLVYVNHSETLKINLTTNKNTFGKREKVEANLETLYRDDMEAEGSFSVSVYNATLIKDEEAHPLNIENYLSLTSDLKGHIEDPGYYFKDTLTETKSHLDLLMLTQGWRRFTWKEVLTDSLNVLPYAHEIGITVSGSVGKVWTKGPASGVRLKLLTSFADLVTLESDSAGRFFTDDLIYFGSTDLIVQTESAKGSKKEYKLEIDPFNPSPPSLYQPLAFEIFDVRPFLNYRKNQIQAEREYSFLRTAKVLEELKVFEKRDSEKRVGTRLYDKPDQTIDLTKSPGGYQTPLQALQGRVAGLEIIGNPPNLRVQFTRSNQGTVYLMDGMQVSADQVNTIPVNFIKSIDILKGASATIYGAGGVVSINMKENYGQALKVGVHNLRYPGFYKGREFYSPQYDVRDDKPGLPDKRLTLYWNPQVITTLDGSTQFSFFTGDEPAEYIMVVEGITWDGYPGHKSIRFRVE